MGSDATRFLGHGRIDLIGYDIHNRSAIYDICIPYVLLIHVVPTFLGCGKVLEIKVADPLSIWQPEFDDSGVKDEVLQANPGIGRRAWESMTQHMNTFMAYYLDICHILKDPNSMVHILPLGIYVNLKAVCEIDKIPACLEELQKSIHVAGVAEFQFALAAALAATLKIAD